MYSSPDDSAPWFRYRHCIDVNPYLLAVTLCEGLFDMPQADSNSAEQPRYVMKCLGVELLSAGRPAEWHPT